MVRQSPDNFRAGGSPLVRASEILETLGRGASHPRIREAVSQLTHALQCGAVARQAGEPDEVVLGCLLHDIGELCDPPLASGNVSRDDYGVVHHEQVGAAYLLRMGLRQPVPDLVAGHIASKRYLATVTERYEERLSDASRATLRRQGGTMCEEDIAGFRANPLYRSLLKLRSYDDQAKRVDWESELPALASYRTILTEFMEPQPAARHQGNAPLPR